MQNKKLLIGLAALLIAFIVGFAAWHTYYSSHQPQSVAHNQLATVHVAIDTGKTKTSYPHVSANTAYDALMTVSKVHAIPVVKKVYSFGVFIESIDGLPNTKENAWIYYVNGVSGDSAAEKKTLKSGDVVEWRYTKPMY